MLVTAKSDLRRWLKLNIFMPVREVFISQFRHMSRERSSRRLQIEDPWCNTDQYDLGMASGTHILILMLSVHFIENNYHRLLDLHVSWHSRRARNRPDHHQKISTM
jgi:hypothetical protein